ncbi:T9SS type A sorting domain-containing protein [Adhaeribacter rhizoryzae]|uniref:T9SS type A sorting domain-containing protein n=1 Tax=Adhaeribacter rhizoryzae TaxID=2607907 RepID=A0A5M6D8I5_9BACT|nr:T9SS type A sorting domain-containing protein [Adhaeribacter rhizoryzae]KAA5542946.1 T9SS type A sorting domain-containing protein [Adhaeribacter rhizoryzae]
MKKNLLLLLAYSPAPGTAGANILRYPWGQFYAGTLTVLRKAAFVFALIFASLNTLLAQPTIQWENTIQGSDGEDFVMAKQTPDGGYVLGGSSSSNAGLDKTENLKGVADYWIVKLNAAGVKIWDKTLGSNDLDLLRSIDATADGGVIAAGTAGPTASGDKTDNIGGTWIVKLNAAGGKEWDKTIENAGTIIEQTPDGGYILFGGPRILKLNTVGGIVWEKVPTYASNLQQTADGGFILVEPTSATKLNAAGVTQWVQPLSGTGNFYFSQQTANGGYILADSRNGYYILKLNAAGTKEWDKFFTGNMGATLKAVIQTSDGGYILGGETSSGAGIDKSEGNKGPCNGTFCYYRDFWLVKIDVAGNRVWDKTIGAIFNEELRSIEQTTDGGLIIGGQSDSPGKTGGGAFDAVSDKSENSYSIDYWAVKLSNVNTAPPNQLCNLALTSKVTQAEPWYGIYPGGGGGIDLTVTGGTPPYNYTWNNFRNSPEDAPAPVLAPGVYTVVVTDARGCTARGTVEIGKKNDPMRLHTSKIDLNSNGDPMGSIDLSVVGGTGPYKYLWSNGATSEDLTNLAAGTYTVTVTDAFGRKLSTSVTIVNPGNPTPVVCNLVATSKVTPAESWYGMWGPTSGAGAIDVTPSGGTAPYTYKWNTGATTEDLAVAAPGVYTLIITDAKACTTTTTITVSRKNGPLSLVESHTNVTAGGTNNGSIDLTVVGGTGPFKYRWSNGATTEDLTGLAPGTYSVTVIDAFNRTATISVQVLGAGTTALASAKKPTETETFLINESGLTVYPNPAKAQTTVAFTLATAGRYTLDLYDIRGAKVRTITAGQAQANKALTVEVPLGNIAEGIYLLKLQTDKGIATKRISVIR